MDELLKNIIANPENDDLKLVYADVLMQMNDELEREYGEFIYIQCTINPKFENFTILKNRENELINKITKNWFKGIHFNRSDIQFEKGFIQSINFNGKGIDSLQIDRIASVKHMQTLKKLLVCVNKIGDDGVRIIFNSPNLLNLEELSLWNNDVSDEGARIIANSPNSKSLEKLFLNYNKIGNDGAMAICNSKYLKSLKSLWFWTNDEYHITQDVKNSLYDRFQIVHM